MHPDGAFLDIMAMPFAFAMPAGTPYKDISTDAAARVATGPYEISSYTPHQQIVLTRNPAFKQWSPNAPNGHLNRVNITIGVTPEQAVNETAQGQLDWYMEAVPVDRLTQLKAQYPSQVHLYPRNNVTYFSMNERKYPFTKLQVRQAVNYGVDRSGIGEDLRRSGHAHRDSAAAAVSETPTTSRSCIPTTSPRPAAGEAGRRGGRVGDRLDNQLRPGTKGVAVPRQRPESDRVEGHRP